MSGVSAGEVALHPHAVHGHGMNRNYDAGDLKIVCLFF